MKPRVILSVILVLFGVALAFLPAAGKYAMHGSSQRLAGKIFDGNTGFTTDQVARFTALEDSTIRLIDLRPVAEFKKFNIPGAVNLPYDSMLIRDPEPYLNVPGRKIIFYSNGDLYSGYALMLAKGLGYENCFVMEGGLNAWFETVMNSRYTGERITARENALFESRRKARDLCNRVNSLPDSLKTAYIAAQKFDPKKLDGGCE